MTDTRDSQMSFFYFESPTMRELYDCLENWQNIAKKQIRSYSIQKDRGNFCCIVLATSPAMLSRDGISPFKNALGKFQRKALKHIGEAVEFSTDDIELEIVQEIQIKLKDCKTPTDVKSVFLEYFI